MSTTGPSKQFIIRGSIVVGIVIVVLIVQTQWFRSLIHPKQKTPSTQITVGSIVQQDTNTNGIPDWEEKLWGLDPTVLYTNGVSNAQIIGQKKKALGIDATADTTPQNETDALARDLFTLTAALGQSEATDDATLKEIAKKLGNSVDTKDIVNEYSLKDIKTVPTTPASLQAYTTALKRLTDTYRTPVADIDAVVQALQTEDATTLEQLSTTSALYKRFGQELRTIPVPTGLGLAHLQVMNSVTGIATSFTYIQEFQDNGIVALVGVATYKTYAGRLSAAYVEIGDYLAQYGILQS